MVKLRRPAVNARPRKTPRRPECGASGNESEDAQNTPRSKRRTAGRFESVPGSHTQSLGRLRKSLAGKAKVAQELPSNPSSAVTREKPGEKASTGTREYVAMLKNTN